MNSREMVIKAIKFDYPERVPRDLWVLPVAVNKNGMESLDEIQKKYPIDMQHEWRYLNGGSAFAPGTYIDEWGVTWTNVNYGYAGEVKNSLITGWDDLKKIKIPFHMVEQNVEIIKNRKLDKEKFNLAYGGNLFERSQFLRGVENLYMDICDKEKGFFKMLGMINEYNIEMLKQLCKTEIDAVFMSDDWGSQRSLLIDPQAWRDIFRPYYKQYVKLAHEGGKYFFMHSDGYIMDIYGELAGMEIDAVNSQLFCMDIEEIGKRFKGQITFWGEISRQQALNHPDPEIARQAVRRVKKSLYSEKGGVIAQCSYEGEGRPENIDAVFDEWGNRKRG